MFFFFNDTATTEIYTLSLHDALPIFTDSLTGLPNRRALERHLTEAIGRATERNSQLAVLHCRSEEHTSELQSRQYLVCRLLLEKKKRSKSSRSTHWSQRDTVQLAPPS